MHAWDLRRPVRNHLTMSTTDARLHSIGDVAEATGITPETLRVWERRYGNPVALRLPSGHRRYSEEQVTWLRRVAEALAHGHRPNKVLKLDKPALDALLGQTGGEPPTDAAIQKLLSWTAEFRGLQIRSALEAWWTPEDVVGFLTNRTTPFLRGIGRAWADGTIDVRHEHFASEIVQDALRRLRAGYSRPSDRGGVVLATLPGELHELGLQMAALVCASMSFPHHVLGIDSPVDEIRSAVDELDATVVGISVSLSSGGVETDRTLAALRRELPESVRIVVGGAGARRARRGPRGIEYVDDLEQWAELLRDACPA